MFKEYLITDDTAIIGDTVEEIIEKINNLTFEQYESMCWQAHTMSNLFCADLPRQKQLKWLLDKASQSLQI